MKLFSSALFLSLLFFSFQSAANVIINGTRVVYKSDQKEVTLSLFSENELPTLVQAWIDDGNSKIADQKQQMKNVPFAIVPPMFRMEPQQGQSLRIIYTGKPLPVDRESVYWINIFEIPPMEEDAPENSLQIAYRSRIKLFFRPIEIGTKTTDELSQSLSFKLVNNNGLKLQIDNRSGQYISFSTLKIKSENQVYDFPVTDLGMIPPLSNKIYNLDNKFNKNKLNITYEIINDQGGSSIYHKEL
ncbi:molecular chaperone [Proteus sp. ZN5]|uniref:fimbrial biogenesis chaperone n=1 Tax=Proteus sp. ZN5 TaxID=2697019 RepID=UPI0013E1A94E|nr:molecular chaperone [Proteus sp. ZN5]QIG04317.1 fimbria/pilus periplasmic chaperone [Proteus sp. ZN5]